jgi:cystathionine beta-lyase
MLEDSVFWKQCDALDASVLRKRTSEKWSVYPEDVLPAWVAEMDYPVAPCIQEVLGHMVAQSDLGYPYLEGPRVALFKKLLARKYARYGWDVPAGQLELLGDVVQGLYVALSAYSQPGDGVMVFTPIYPPFLSSVERMGRVLECQPLRRTQKGYVLDIDALKKHDYTRTKMVLLCHPHNPTGRVFSEEERRAIADVALEHGLVVVSDEIHADLVYAPQTFRCFASLGSEVAARTVTLTSASKAFSIPGLHCAAALFGSEALQEAFCAMPRHFRAGASIVGIEASVAAWEGGHGWLEAVVGYLDNNRKHLESFVREHLPQVVFHAPESTYLAWLDCEALALPMPPTAFFLHKARVALGDGPQFGAEGQHCVRVNFATSLRILNHVLERMKHSVHTNR